MDYYFIPANYTDSGKVLGIFPVRNLIEAAILGLPILFLVFRCLPLTLSWRIMVGMTLTVPASGLALIGIDDAPLSAFLRIWYQWRRHRRIIEYRGAAL